MHLLIATVQQWDIDVAVVCEPNIKICRKNWSFDTGRTVAIKTFGNRVHSIRTGGGEGYVWLETSECLVIGAYFSPNGDIQDLDALLYDIGKTARDAKRPTILAGDLNAKSPLWGSRDVNARGTSVAEWMLSSGMEIANVGDSPTFERRGSSSVIDVTLTSQNISGRLTGWKVHTDIENLSDHHYITFSLSASDRQKKDQEDHRKNQQLKKSWKIDDDALEAVEAEMSRAHFGESTDDPGK
jgi:Endonuclease-reverse transcriptase